jgi:hypothetical protein
MCQLDHEFLNLTLLLCFIFFLEYTGELCITALRRIHVQKEKGKENYLQMHPLQKTHNQA